MLGLLLRLGLGLGVSVAAGYHPPHLPQLVGTLVFLDTPLFSFLLCYVISLQKISSNEVQCGKRTIC